MKKIITLALTLCLGTLLLVGCGGNKDNGEVNVKDAEGYASDLRESGLTIEELEIYTAETDPNELLGRPNQYTSKVNFSNGSIEVFENKKDVESRKEYIDSLGEATPIFAEYSYIKDNTLLRIDKSLTPDEAKKYEEAFMGL